MIHRYPIFQNIDQNIPLDGKTMHEDGLDINENLFNRLHLIFFNYTHVFLRPMCLFKLPDIIHSTIFHYMYVVHKENGLTRYPLTTSRLTSFIILENSFFFYRIFCRGDLFKKNLGLLNDPSQFF